jgi:hypothetical protein
MLDSRRFAGSLLLVTLLATGIYGSPASAGEGDARSDRVPILEFRIVASKKHDADAFAKAVKPDGSRATPEGYRWVKLGPDLKEESLNDSLVRSDATGGQKWVLMKLGGQDVTDRELERVYKTEDEHLKPAIGFAFGRKGTRRFGELTRAHLPEEVGNFKHKLAIIVEGTAISAPSINAEIRDQAIIEFGTTSDPKQVERLFDRLQASVAASRARMTAQEVKDQVEAIRRATEVDLPIIAEEADRAVLLPANGVDAVVLTKPEEVAELRQALKPEAVPPSGGIRAATVAFYNGTSMVRQVWIYEGGEWGFVRPGTSWTTGNSPELWDLVRRRLKK